MRVVKVVLLGLDGELDRGIMTVIVQSNVERTRLQIAGFPLATTGSAS